jgi:type III secretion protein K
MTDLLRLVIRDRLHPELDLHPSWLPRRWPARHRNVTRFGPAGQAVLCDLLRRGIGDRLDYDVASPLRRLALLDGPSLRRVAAYTGLGAHQSLLSLRSVSRQLRRQARRIAPDAADFVARRMPPLDGLRMNPARLQERPSAVGRVVMDRGYRLLLGTLAADGEALVQRVLWKLPRRVAALAPAPLSPHQAQQLRELMAMCIVPERLPQWDWLF